MRRIFPSKFGDAEYNANGAYTGYRYTPGGPDDPAVIAAGITDWSKVTDPRLCWLNPILKQTLTSDNWDAYNAAQARCMGQTYTPYYAAGGAYEAGLTPGAGTMNNNPVAYIGNTPISQMTNLSPATAALLPAGTITASDLPVQTPANNLTASLPAPIANVVNNVTSNPLLLLAVIGAVIYFGTKK